MIFSHLRASAVLLSGILFLGSTVGVTAQEPSPTPAAIAQPSGTPGPGGKKPTPAPGNAAAAVASGESIVSNGNLEAPNAEGSWPQGWGKAKTGGTWESEGGNHFVRLAQTQPGGMVVWYQLIPIPPGTQALTLTWRQRLTDVKKGSALYYDARIMMEFKDASGTKMAGKPGPPNGSGTSKGWVEKGISFLVPEGAVSMEFMPTLFQTKSGTFDLDDFALVPTDPAPILAAQKAREAMKNAAYVEPEAPDRSKWPAELHVQGNRLVNKDGTEVWLQGISTSGLETLPSDTFAMKSVKTAIEGWKARVVRVPVKEEFWFGRNGVQKDGGEAYRKQIDDLVNLAANRGAYLMLDLHRFRAPKQEHADFWTDAATRYKDHPAVLFDIFNEPNGIGWEVWRNGGEVKRELSKVDEAAFLTPEEKAKNSVFQSVGMQGLVDAVRATGAKNIIVAGGIGYAGDLSGVVNGYALDDKGGNGIMYSWHQYNWHKGWDKTVLPVAEKYPIMVGEFGADINKMDFIPAGNQEDPYTWVPDMLGFIQKYRLNYTGWCFAPNSSPLLISDWNYTPTPYWGAFLKEALDGKQFEMKRMR